MMTYGTISDDRKKIHGEVFTPPGIVFRMVLAETFIEELKKLEKTFFDPCVGEGQFPCAELVLKMFYNLDKLNPQNVITMLRSLHGMDIQPDSIAKCRKHMEQTLYDAYNFFTGENFPKSLYTKIILCQNFSVGDSLKFMQGIPQLTLFENIGE